MTEWHSSLRQPLSDQAANQQWKDDKISTSTRSMHNKVLPVPTVGLKSGNVFTYMAAFCIDSLESDIDSTVFKGKRE